jgi:hypothetical protein
MGLHLEPPNEVGYFTNLHGNVHAVAYWIRHYATNRKVVGSIPYEVIFKIYLILPATLGPGVYSASNRTEYQKQKNDVSGE